MPCFSYPARDEVEVNGRKIIGSAQKRTGPRFLQHGSIPLASDDDLLMAVSKRHGVSDKIRMMSLSEAFGRTVNFVWAVKHLVAGLAEFFRIDFETLVLTAGDLAAIGRLRDAKYATDAWTLRAET
jgi:lipoate-protein ligase A